MFLKKRVLSATQKKLKSVQLGSRGEIQAAHFLISHGFKILDSNVRYKNCEVDLIALDLKTNELVFVEVKTRQTDYYGSPSFAVGYQKLHHLITVSAIYRKEKRLWLDFRFDIISILPDSIEHNENISW